MLDTPVRASAAETERCAASVSDRDHTAGTPWAWACRNARAPAADTQALSWTRIVALALALALHVAMLLRLTVPPPPWLPASAETTRGAATAIGTGTPADGLRVVFVDQTAAVPDDVVVDAIATTSSSVTTSGPMWPAPRAAASSPAALTPAAPMSDPRALASEVTDATGETGEQESVADGSAPAARLFLPDGSVALPAAAIADLHAVESENRVFDYMTPGLADAASAFTRRPALPYAPTRFDANWTRVRTLGDAVFIPIAEALTYENESRSFRCSVLPPGCSWGRVVDAVELDDPLTLNPMEAAQCRALWDSIVAATDQDDWLTLRARFDSECRKPLEN